MAVTVPLSSILVIAGAPTAAHPAARLAALLVRQIALQRADVMHLSLEDYPLEAWIAGAPIPPNAARLARMIEPQACVVLVGAEINGHPDVALLSALDWLAGATAGRAFRHRRLALATAAATVARAESCLAALRSTLASGFDSKADQEALVLAGTNLFDERGEIATADHRARLQSFAVRSIERAQRKETAS